MAKIGIDCRLWGSKNAGIGRYTENLVRNLAQVDSINQYVLYCKKEEEASLPKRPGWKTIIVNSPLYTLREQLSLPGILNKENLDLMHFPHFNVPILYKGKFIITIHDLLWFNNKNLEATTLPVPVYLAKHFAYKRVINNAIKKAENIIVPSKVVKDEVIDKFRISEDKIRVIYEGVSISSSEANNGLLAKHKISKPYLLYVGSLYPHKNVEAVVKALNDCLNKSKKMSFIVVSKKDMFWERFKRFVEKEKAAKWVKMLGYVDDLELKTIYKNAAAFVFPTLSEGFGLPGLEAMNCGVPVISSNIPVLREVYGNAALYFDPKNIDDIKEKIGKVVDSPKLRQEMSSRGTKQAGKFSWKNMTQETLEIYKDSM